MRKQQIYDQEKISFNLVKFQSHSKHFEIVIDPDAAVKFKEKNIEDVLETLNSENVFSDAKKGILASEEDILTVFKTKDIKSIANKMFAEGEVQLTSDYREKLREQKKKRIINIIHSITINPRTNTPHPQTRIENAMVEAKVKIDEFKSAKEQVKTILDKLKPIIPIKKDEFLLSLKLGISKASNIYGYLSKVGQIKNSKWGASNFTCELLVPGGLKNEVISELNSITSGEIQIKINE